MPKAERIQEKTFDHAVWRNLPEDVILIVLSKLHYNSLVQFRSVCKKWNKYIIERGQAVDPAEYQVAGPVPVKCDPGTFSVKQLTVYNSRIRRWEKLSLGFIGKTQGGEMPGSYTLAATDGGLLCFRDSSFTSFVVSNPLTKRWRHLIPPSSVLPQSLVSWDLCVRDCMCHCSRLSDYILVGLAVDSQSGSYKIVVTGLHENGKTLIYDSSEDMWSLGAPVLLPIPLFNRQFRYFQYNGKSVNYYGHLYWLITEGYEPLTSVSVVKYDLDTDSWLATNFTRYPRGSLVRSYKGTMCVMTLDRARIPRFWAGRQWFLQVLETETRFCLISRRIAEYSIYKIDTMPIISKDYTQEYQRCVGQGVDVFIVYKIMSGTNHLGYRLVNFDIFMKKYDLLNSQEQDQSVEWPPMYSDMVDAETWSDFIPSFRTRV